MSVNKRKTIKRSLYKCGISLGRFNWIHYQGNTCSTQELIDDLERIQDEAKREGYEKVEYSLSGPIGVRLETDEEYDKRIQVAQKRTKTRRANAKKMANVQNKREYNLYLQLREKYKQLEDDEEDE